MVKEFPKFYESRAHRSQQSEPSPLLLQPFNLLLSP